MDTAEEKSNTLSRCGSFYYNTLVDSSKDDAEFVSHLTWNSKFPAQLQNIISAVMGRSHFQDFYRLIKFTDADVNWRGMKAALQHRSSVPPSNPQIPDYNNRLPDYILGEGAAIESNAMLLGDSEAQALIAPKANTWITLPGDTQLFWELNIDDSLFVTTIRTPEGKLWYAGQEYTAQYGKLTFTENPIKLFPDMEFMAESCIVRKPHIYNHMLRLGSVYETPDRILHYYRQAQTPKTFYLAAAQACGLAVIRQDCTIVNRMPLFDGYSYSTTDGIYEAPYKHTALDKGTALAAGYIIGGQELFQLCSPGEPLPPNVTRLNLDNALPVPGLSVTNKEIQVWNESGQYRPAYDGDIDAVEAWHAYLQGVRDDAESTGGTGITHTFDQATGNVLKPIVQQAIVANNYNTGEACSMYFTVLTASGSNTYPLLRLADDYFLITQDGRYIGFSSSATSMKNANGGDPGWAPSQIEKDDFGFDYNAFESDTRIYGWISRNAAGATGQPNALPIPGMVIDIQYKMSVDNPDGLFIEMHDSNYNVSEVLRMNMGVLDLHKIDTGNITVRVSNIKSKDTVGLPVSEPGIVHFRDVACKDRCLVACVNEAFMSTEMQLRLREFLRRELPTGAVLVTADLPTIVNDVVQPEPEPKPEPLPPLPRVARTVDPDGGDPGQGGWRGFSLSIATTAACFEWTTDTPSAKPIFLSEVEMACAASGTPASYTVKLAAYNARTAEFLGVSNTQTFEAGKSKIFHFDNVQVPLTDQIVLVFVKAETSTADLLNPIALGLDTGDLEDGMVATAWRFKVWDLGSSGAPDKWGLVGPNSSELIPSGPQQYIPVLTLRFMQQV